MEYPSKRNYTSDKMLCKNLTLEDDPQLIEDHVKVHAADDTLQLIEQIYKLGD